AFSKRLFGRVFAYRPLMRQQAPFLLDRPVESRVAACDQLWHAENCVTSGCGCRAPVSRCRLAWCRRRQAPADFRLPLNYPGALRLGLQQCLDVLDHGFKLLVRQGLDRIAVLELMLAGNQQREQFAVCSRLRRRHGSYCPLTLTPEMAQQCSDKLLIQYCAVTRAAWPAGSVS